MKLKSPLLLLSISGGQLQVGKLEVLPHITAGWRCQRLPRERRALMDSLCLSVQQLIEPFRWFQPFFSPITWGAGVQSEYNGPTLRPSSEKLRRPPSDMIAWARGNEWLLLSLPHFPAGCPVVGWRSVFCVFLQRCWVTHKAALHKHHVWMAEGAPWWQTGCNLLSLNSNSFFYFFYYWLCWKACSSGSDEGSVCI